MTSTPEPLADALRALQQSNAALAASVSRPTPEPEQAPAPAPAPAPRTPEQIADAIKSAVMADLDARRASFVVHPAPLSLDDYAREFGRGTA